MDIVRREHNGVSFYTCTGFSQIPHGFSTRLGGVSPAPWDNLNLGVNRGDEPDRVAENYRRFCRAIGADPTAIVKHHQIHSTLVRPVTKAHILPPEVPTALEGDGLITDEPGVCLTVFSADCIPLLFFDPNRQVIAAAHAGWKGTAQGIAAQTVKQMVNDYRCCPSDILAAIGPGISSCCFETHQDVPDSLRAHLGSDAVLLARPLPQPGKYLVDLKKANQIWLFRSGLLPEHIAVSDACTACQPDSFWSHRRLGTRRGSMAAMIQLPDPSPK